MSRSVRRTAVGAIAATTTVAALTAGAVGAAQAGALPSAGANSTTLKPGQDVTVQTGSFFPTTTCIQNWSVEDVAKVKLNGADGNGWIEVMANAPYGQKCVTNQWRGVDIEVTNIGTVSVEVNPR